MKLGDGTFKCEYCDHEPFPDGHRYGLHIRWHHPDKIGAKNREPTVEEICSALLAKVVGIINTDAQHITEINRLRHDLNESRKKIADLLNTQQDHTENEKILEKENTRLKNELDRFIKIHNRQVIGHEPLTTADEVKRLANITPKGFKQ